MNRDDLLDEARRLDGLHTGMCEPSEYQHLIEAGLLRKSWTGASGLLGMSKLVLTEDAVGAA